MALNIQTLKTRALTAIIFVGIMLFGLLYNYWSFFVLFSIIHFGCWKEYQKLVGLIDKDYANISTFHKYAVMLGGFGFMMMNVLADFSSIIPQIGLWVVVICFVIFPVKEIVLSKENNAKVVAHSFFGLAYISLSWGLMINLNNICPLLKITDNSLQSLASVPIILIASIWINDTMAYIVGSIIGKTPLTKISPKKTWEGTVGGAILAVVVVSVLCYFFIGKQSFFLAIGISSIAAIVGTLGDLLESKLKRLAGVKDSGNFMPGHGGFLDRFDSLLLATPFVWLFICLI
jgi:phosphatidate cytidylyltransferase